MFFAYGWEKPSQRFSGQWKNIDNVLNVLLKNLYDVEGQIDLCVIGENGNIHPFHTQAYQVIECPQADTINAKMQITFVLA